MRSKLRDRQGQASVELMTVLPVAIILATVAVNALLFFSDCAAFDRIARNAARTYAASPAYGEELGDSTASIQAALDASFSRNNLSCEVSTTSSGSFVRVKAKLSFAPTLFGLGLKQEILGVSLPKLTHETSLTVCRYRPGVIF